MNKVLGLITARGGSKGIPGKNRKDLCGKPVIAWTIEAALQSTVLDRIVVSTDDEQIINIVNQYNVEAPFVRPGELATDRSPHIYSVLHALDWLKNNENYIPERVCLLQPTSPLRIAEDIDGAVKLAIEKNVDAVVSITYCHQHPLHAKKLDKDGKLYPFVNSERVYERRQDLPEVFTLNGAVYVNKEESLRRDQCFYPAETLGYVMPLERSLEIDTPLDFILVGALMKKRLKAEI